MICINSDLNKFINYKNSKFNISKDKFAKKMYFKCFLKYDFSLKKKKLNLYNITFLKNLKI